jgi:hypothetical protein
MKRHAGIIVLCAALFCGGAGRAAELLGSPDPEIRKNFNRLLTTNACPRCDLRGVVLNRIDLFGADLSGANLAGAQLGHACLAGANLRNANLNGAWLGGADLSGTDIAGASFEGADFTADGPATAKDDDESKDKIGHQVTAAAANAVNSTLNELFGQLAQPPASSPPMPAAAPAQEAEAASPLVQPLNQTPAAAERPRRSVDEIPVIEPAAPQPPKLQAKPRFWERIWLDSTEKERRKSQENKTAPVDGSSQPVPSERAGVLVAAPPQSAVC